MNVKDLLDNSTVKSFLAPLRRTATTVCDAVDLKGIGRKLFVILDAGNFADTGTLTVVIEESTDSVTFTTLHTFATLDAVGALVADLAPSKRYVRVNVTACADTIDFAVEGIIYLERKRPSGL